MSDEKEVKEGTDRPKEAPTKSDVLSADENKSVQEKAAANASDRKKFLEQSLGQARSHSTEHLKDMVLTIVDGAKQIVGLASNDAAKGAKAADSPPATADSGIAGMVTNDLSIRHPIDSAVEIYHRIRGDAPAEAPRQPSDVPAQPPEKAAEASKPEEKPEDVLRKIKEDPEAKAQREHLEEVARSKMKPDEFKKFQEDMDSLEKRASEQKPPMTPDKVRDTYKEVFRLIEAPDGKDVPIKVGDRVKLAEQVMHQAAHPTSVDQGYHNTCNVATVEARLYTTDPSRAAKLVSDVATTGKTDIPGPPLRTVEIDPNSLKPDNEGRLNPPKDGSRSHASQVFEVAAVNISWALENARQSPPGQIRYEQHKPVPGLNPPDTGERLMDYSKKPPQEVREDSPPHKPDRTPSISNDRIVELSHQLARPVDRQAAEKAAEDISKACAGADSESICKTLCNKGKPERDEICKVYEQKHGHSLDKDLQDGLPAAESAKALDLLHKPDVLLSRYSGSDQVNSVRWESDLRDELKRLKDANRLPAIVAVHTDHYPFHCDGQQAGGKGAWHVVNITDYDESTGKVSIDNQWGAKADHFGKNAVDVHDLYQAMQEPKQESHIRDLQQDIRTGTPQEPADLLRETQLLRIKRSMGKLTDKELGDELHKTYERARKLRDEQQKTGTLDQHEHDKINDELGELFFQLSPAEQKSVLKRKEALDKRNNWK